MEEKKSLVVKYVDTSNGGNDNNKSKLRGGKIAGIVIGCIAGVTIIALIIVIIIKKKNGQQGSSDQGDDGKVEL